MEYVDILDEHGEPTGRSVPRTELDPENDWVLTAHLWIFDSQDRLLMQRRAPGKKTSPNKWDISVAGHVSSGETSEESVIRETKEELGIQVGAEELEKVGRFADPKHRYIQDRFRICKDVDPAALSLDAEEVAEVRWFTMGELAKRLAESPNDFVDREEEFALICHPSAV